MKKNLLFCLSCLLSFFAVNAQTSVTLKPGAAVGKDAVVFSNNANRNYGDVESLTAYTWTNSGNLGVKRFYLQFDLSTIPANAKIDSAFLHFYYNPVDSYEGFDFHSGDNVFQIKRVTSPWEEDSITWNKQPNNSNQNHVLVPRYIDSNQNYVVNVTDLTFDMHTNGNFGYVVRMENEVNYYRSVLLSSSDHPNASLHPELRIVYSVSTGINDNQKDLSSLFTIFPNPSKGIIRLRSNTVLNDHQIRVLDLSGKEINAQFDLLNASIDLSNQAKGIYFLEIINNEGARAVKKIILQ